MSQIIELIKELRERTGAGMMDCKRALEASDLDIPRALDWLREKGITKAASKSARIAAEGITHVVSEGNKRLIIEVNCETDFVARGDAFINLVDAIAKMLLKDGITSIEAAKESATPLITEATMKIGEKIDLRRFEVYEATAGQVVGSYIHMNGKYSSLVLMTGVDQTFVNNMAMHITANNPRFVDMDSIPSADRLHEAKIQRELMAQDEKLKGKPEAALEKILEGKVSKTFRELTLSEQAYLMDEAGALVGSVLAKVGGRVLKFVRYAVGEGIEKRADNFAEEVMAQIK
ncbi:MAG TPA: translation elongation factor Ts [Bacilli bacterium]|nr:translation elongation factor Ts [Bacilli bacterium]